MSTLNSADALEKTLTETTINLGRGIELLPKFENPESFTPALQGLIREIQAQIEIIDGFISNKLAKKR
jgi:hypothetical protein